MPFLARDQQKLNTVVQQLENNTIAIQGDVCNLSDIDKLYHQVKPQLGLIDVLVVNAGIAGDDTLETMTEQHFDNIMNTNLKGAYFTVQKSVPFLRDGASIILISSMACHGGWPHLSVYSATKAALSVLAQSFSADLIHRGIRVNAISPGFTDTPIYTDRTALVSCAKTVPLKTKRRARRNRRCSVVSCECGLYRGRRFTDRRWYIDHSY